MEMVTTCPHCATSFRVTPDHLRVRAGKVRCGKCANVFDGFHALTTRDALASRAAVPVVPAVPVAAAVDAVAPAPAPAHVPAVPEAPSVEQPVTKVTTETPALAPVAAESPLNSEDSEHIELVSTQDLMAQPVTAPLAAAQPAPLPVAQTAVFTHETAATPEQDIYKRLTPVEAVSHTPAPAHMPAPARAAGSVAHDYPEEDATPKRRSGLWAFAAFVALIALAGQAIHVYRNELASKFPAIKPALAQFCEYAACKVLPLQSPELLKTEVLKLLASDLQVTDPSKPSVIQLTATLRNYSNMEIGYPALDLVLTDNREHTLVRRIFLPADYLARPDALTAGIAANAEVTVRIDIDAGTLGAAGFRLNLSPAVSD